MGSRTPAAPATVTSRRMTEGSGAHREKRRVRQQRSADDLHQRARQPVVRPQQALPLAIEAPERAVPLGEVARHEGRQALGGGERVGDPAGGQRIAGARGVAEQHGARGEPGARAPGHARASRGRGERSGAVESVAQEGLGGDPALERPARAAAERPLVAEPCHEELTVGQRRGVELVATADEDLQVVGERASRRQAKVHPHAGAPRGTRGDVEPKRAPHRRLEPVGADHQGGAPELSPDAQPDGPPAFELDPLDGGVLVETHAGRRAGRADEHVVEPEAPLRQRGHLGVAGRREGGRGGEAEAVIPDGRKRAAADGVAQPEALEHRHAAWHDPLAAGLVAREAPGVVEVDAQAGAAQQDRQRRPGRSAARDDDVYGHGKGHGHGMKRGLSAKARR